METEKRVTISTHNGSSYCREHNKRNPLVVAREDHIRIDGSFEIWKDESPKEAYKRIFGKALDEYNAKQTREDRKIRSYYKKICDDEKKHPVYEMIVGIYGKDEQGNPICSKEDGKIILKTFIDTWAERNPHLELIGAYYHDDEAGEPHVHASYIAYATGYSTGLSVQSSISKALQQQGFIRQGKQTEQILWEARENQYLGSLCAARGLKVIHKESKIEHLNTEIFKKTRELKELEQQTKEAEKSMDAVKSELESAKDDLLTLKDQASLSRVVQEAYKEPEHPVEILEQYPEKKTLSGKAQPAAVKISRSDYDDLCRRAMASDWIKNALAQLKSVGERLVKELNQRKRVSELKSRVEEAKANETILEAKVATLTTECHQKDEHIENISVFFEEKHLLDSFIKWLGNLRGRSEQEINDLTAEIDNPDRER